jgi:UPF0716 protein FxsA
MVKWVIIAILLFPVAEIVVFLVVAALIGSLWTFVLLLAAMAGGVLVLRQAGRKRIARLRVAVADTDITWIEANTGGSLMVLAGILLLLPGFLTDLVGIALLIGPLRRRLGRALRGFVRSRDQRDRSFIDLAPTEWEQVPDRELPNKSKKKRRD